MGRKESIDTFCKFLHYIVFNGIVEIINVSALSKELDIDRSTLTRYIKKLKEYNLFLIKNDN
jgi:DNA-binding MarR family transcriptional regulator